MHPCFRKPEARENFPVAADLVQQLPRLDLLWIAGLFHDIGKGRGGDHSLIGARDVEAFAWEHDLSERDTRLVSWLVENHLLMSMVAQKRDITDPEVISDFARSVGDETRLDYLYVLTVADINATNPTLWNGWRAPCFASSMAKPGAPCVAVSRTPWNATTRCVRHATRPTPC